MKSIKYNILSNKVTKGVIIDNNEYFIYFQIKFIIFFLLN